MSKYWRNIAASMAAVVALLGITTACSSPPPANPDVPPQECEALEFRDDEDLAKKCRDYAVDYTLRIPKVTWIFGS